jgi:DNA-binding IclR family transcriptional regulator
MRSADRVLAMLDLFSDEKSVWTAEEAAGTLDVSVSTAYRYIKSLCTTGLLVPVSGDEYRLGPAILKYDRLIRITDPLLEAARPIVEQLALNAGREKTVFLSRLYRDTVMCVLEGPNRQRNISYERGRPMPMFRGATSKVILAYLPRRTLKRLYDTNAEMIANTTGTRSWRGFLNILREIRSIGLCRAENEVDANVAGIAAPVFDSDGNITGSLTIAGIASRMRVSEANQLADMAVNCADAITVKQARSGASVPFSPRIVA